MLESHIVTVGEKKLQGVRVSLPNAPVLMLVGSKGFLGCGYFGVDVADKVGHALAVVSGVSSFDDMLGATVKAFSTAAGDIGITTEMTGAEAAELLA
ncbi:MAG: DUF1805 domain-containing protein [Kiritimatiellia bacterium]|jgi:uncharacterized protein YunC (DUF1805 family)|nr:DUF1805 domain-containing protein [Kiritimatiellia bacterium]MDP6847795.1 DUF1805 domain-containing protein [Kiritimatiellia bacterium]